MDFVRPCFFFVSQVKIQYEWSHHFFSLWELAVARRFVPMFDSSAGKLGAKNTGFFGENVAVYVYLYVIIRIYYVYLYIYISNSYCFHRNHIFFSFLVSKK